MVFGKGENGKYYVERERARGKQKIKCSMV